MDEKDFPRIAVITRSDNFRTWKAALGDRIWCARWLQPLYGMRLDLLIIDMPLVDLEPEGLTRRAFVAQYLDDIRCRVGSTGKIVYVR